MLKYTTAEVTFREIPDEITLCINISNCPIRCPDCHSKELWGDIGETLTPEKIVSLIEENPGISCVCILGGDSEYNALQDVISTIIAYNTENNTHIKTAIYSGRDNLQELIKLAGLWIDAVDYIKVGPYIKEKGGLNNPNTNQRLYELSTFSSQIIAKVSNTIFTGYDITHKFWRNDSTATD